MKKNFKGMAIQSDPVIDMVGMKEEDFIKSQHEPEVKLAVQSIGDLPIGNSETKSKRVQVLMRPSTHKKLKAMAKGKSVSVNELINIILESSIS